MANSEAGERNRQGCPAKRINMRSLEKKIWQQEGKEEEFKGQVPSHPATQPLHIVRGKEKVY